MKSGILLEVMFILTDNVDCMRERDRIADNF